MGEGKEGEERGRRGKQRGRKWGEEIDPHGSGNMGQSGGCSPAGSQEGGGRWRERGRRVKRASIRSKHLKAPNDLLLRLGSTS